MAGAASRIKFLLLDMPQTQNRREILSRFLGSRTEARLLRFLFRHPGQWFRVGEIARLIKSNYNTTNSYIGVLEEVGLVQSKMSDPEESEDSQEVGGTVYALNMSFPLYNELRQFVLRSFPVDTERVVEGLKNIGRIRLAILAGLFLDEDSYQVDLFAVGDDIDRTQFENFVATLEADVGATLRYTLMDTSEFTYRYNLYDRFVRNVLKKPHLKLIDDLHIK